MVRGGGFRFSLGLHRPRGPGDDQRGPTFGVHGGIEYFLPLHNHFYAISVPNGLVPSDKAFRTVRFYSRPIWLLFLGGSLTLVLVLGGVQLSLPILQLH